MSLNTSVGHFRAIKLFVDNKLIRKGFLFAMVKDDLNYCMGSIDHVKVDYCIKIVKKVVDAYNVEQDDDKNSVKTVYLVEIGVYLAELYHFAKTIFHEVEFKSKVIIGSNKYLNVRKIMYSLNWYTLFLCYMYFSRQKSL